MSVIRTEPDTRPNTEPDTELDSWPASSAGWREFTDADVRRDAIAADLALDLAADPLDVDL
jgi:hypothetical protein